MDDDGSEFAYPPPASATQTRETNGGAKMNPTQRAGDAVVGPGGGRRATRRRSPRLELGLWVRLSLRAGGGSCGVGGRARRAGALGKRGRDGEARDVARARTRHPRALADANML